MTTLTNLEKLIELLEELREKEHGCQWTRAQTMQSLTRHTLEEVYELIDAIDKNDWQAIRGELGDLPGPTHEKLML